MSATYCEDIGTDALIQKHIVHMEKIKERIGSDSDSKRYLC